MGAFEGRRLAELRDELGADLATTSSGPRLPPARRREPLARWRAASPPSARARRRRPRPPPRCATGRPPRLARPLARLGPARETAGPLRRQRPSLFTLAPTAPRVRGERALALDGGRDVSGSHRCLFWVQSLRGSGHLRRALAVAGSRWRRGFDVTLANGGPPSPWPAPKGIDIVQLPSLSASGPTSGRSWRRGTVAGEPVWQASASAAEPGRDDAAGRPPNRDVPLRPPRVPARAAAAARCRGETRLGRSSWPRSATSRQQGGRRQVPLDVGRRERRLLAILVHATSACSRSGSVFRSRPNSPRPPPTGFVLNEAAQRRPARAWSRRRSS